jgi:uncharacterized protein
MWILPVHLMAATRAWALLVVVAFGPGRRAPSPRPESRATAAPAGTLATAPSPSSIAAAAEPPGYAVALPARVSTHLRLRLDRCKSGDDPACLDAATMLLDPRVAPDRPALAARLLLAACERTYLAACAELGWLHARGLGVAYNPTRARALMQRACSAGDAHGCARLGEELVFAGHFPQDLTLGMAALERACDGSDAGGCAGLARALEGDAAARAHRKAIELASRSCRSGQYHGCQALVREAGGGSSDSARRHAREMACRAGGDCSFVELDDTTRRGLCSQGHDSSCVDLAYHGGRSFDTPETFRWLKQACLAGLARGCWALNYWVSPVEKYDVLAQACQEGELGACAFYVRDEPEPGKRNPQSTPDLPARREFACTRGSARHCRLMLLARSASADRTAFVRSFEQTCPLVRYRIEGRDVDAEGCRLAAAAYRNGDGVPRDSARALSLYRRACFPESSPRYSGRALSACVSAAEMFDKGEGVDRDPAMATAWLAGACRAGEATACPLLAERVERGIGIAANPTHAARIRTYRSGGFGELRP